MKKLEGEKKKVESDYNATNSRIQVDDEDVADGDTNDGDNDNDDAKRMMVVVIIKHCQRHNGPRN